MLQIRLSTSGLQMATSYFLLPCLRASGSGPLMHVLLADELYPVAWKPTTVDNVPQFGQGTPLAPPLRTSVTRVVWQELVSNPRKIGLKLATQLPASEFVLETLSR
jgi:hypothetical protein